MQLSANQTLHGFTILTDEELPEIEGKAFTGVHDASGARLLYLCNDDNNKSFAIGFRTPPKDDTGVFHILEHSVLCGSRKFPVKEPFVDLLKGSMQTFLNAMTFADKTLYPVASTNEQDLFNLMDVYMDAVFHPRIYQKRAIFEQEGWHYELRAHDPQAADVASLDAEQTTLVHNGVVFNEMKGALSDATSVLYDELQRALFPDTCYSFESGGTPEAIPTLTYEEYLDEHARHYRTDNSYIILYGNMDIDRALAFLDEQYLTPVAEEQRRADEARLEQGLELLRPRSINAQKPLVADHVVYPMDTAPENACSACGYVIGDSSERMRALAVEILLDALFGSNEAPLKRALLDEGVAHDVQAFVSDALMQPFAVVQLQMPSDGAACNLASTLNRLTREMLERGLDKEIVEAALSHDEFVMREHDMGYADGVIDSMLALSSWLYDDDSATTYLRYERAFAELRQQLEGDYFETLCRELFCECPHSASVEVLPTPTEGPDEMARALEELNQSLSFEQRRRIVEEEAVLRELQEAPDTPEAIATLPRLSVADIQGAPELPDYGLDESAPVTCVRHRVPTRGIVYTYRFFDMSHLTFDDLPYVGILALVLGKLDTAKHTAAEIDTMVQGLLGNMSFYVTVSESMDDVLDPRPLFGVSASALSKNVETAATLPLEVMTQTDFSSAEKVLDLLKQHKIALEQHFANAGHTCASARCKSYYSAAGIISETISNIGFYQFICDLIEHYDERAGQLAGRLAEVASKLFDDGACTFSLAGTDDDIERFWAAGPLCGTRNDLSKRLVIPAPVKRNEGFVVPSDVCYAALGWDRRCIDGGVTPFDGSWIVAARALSLDYLWNEVRVKGGAYGTGFQAILGGNMRFYSYRDPHLDQTLEKFAGAREWLEAFDPSQEDLEGFIVSSAASIDAPMKPRALIRRQMVYFFAHRPEEDWHTVRRQIIACDIESVRAFANILGRVADERCICVFGNRSILESSDAGLEIINLIG